MGSVRIGQVSNAWGCSGSGDGFSRGPLGERWLLPLPCLPPPHWDLVPVAGCEVR